MKTLTTSAGAVIACLTIGIAGCASTPPSELRNARSAYQNLAQSPAAAVAPTEVYEAKRSLDIAERGFAEDGDEPQVRDLAYVAERKAVIASSRANTAIAMQAKQVALQEADQIRQKQAMASREQLGQTKEQLSMTQAQLESERQARIAAERRTANAVIKIQGLTSKEDARGLVLTISGEVVFASGKSELLPAARKRLDDVAMALKDDPRPIVIVGHTDSRGDDEMNMRLSERRADAVRQYLTMHGIREDRVVAQGAGETQPVADNKSAEGRANNRRVELILQGPNQAEAMPGAGQQKSRTDQGMQQPSTDHKKHQDMQKPGGTKQKPAKPDTTQPGTGGTMQQPDTNQPQPKP